MKGLVITHGTICNIDFYRDMEYDVCVCADGGIEYAHKLNITPDLIIGDFDSCDRNLLDEFIKKGVKVQKFPVEKDFTDTQLAVDAAVDMGCDEITIIGGIGYRLDHTIANVHILADLVRRNIQGRIVDEHNEIFIIKGEKRVQGRPGCIISLIPFGGRAEGLKSKGLYYPLPDFMDIYKPCGVSNVFTEEEAWIVVEKGMLLAVMARE